MSRTSRRGAATRRSALGLGGWETAVRHGGPERHRRESRPPHRRPGTPAMPVAPRTATPAGRRTWPSRGVGRARNGNRRYGGVGQQRAEDHHGVDVEFVGDRQQARRRTAPAHIGLTPCMSTMSRSAPGGRQWEICIDGHTSSRGHPVHLADDRPVDLVVVIGPSSISMIGWASQISKSRCSSARWRRRRRRSSPRTPHDDGVVEFGQGPWLPLKFDGVPTSG